MTEPNEARAPSRAGAFCGHVVIGALALASAAPTMAQSVLSPDPLPGARSCAEFMAMGSAARLQMLTAIQPLGDDLESADPAFAAQWSGEVASACARDPNLPLADAAARALQTD